MKKTIWIICIIVFSLKLFILIQMPTPWIFADEVVYSETARVMMMEGKSKPDIAYAQLYPPGYPAIILITYLFSDMTLVYKLSLIVNSLLGVSIIPLSYLLLIRITTNKNLAIIIATLTALLPSVFSYSFVIMSENLFIPLYLLLNIFIIKAFEKHDIKFWLLVFALSGLLFTIRSQGIVILLAVVLMSIIYLIIFKKYRKNIYVVYAISTLLVAPYVLLQLLKNNLTIGYNLSYYTNNISEWFTFEGFKLFGLLLMNELTYVFAATFSIGFIGFVLCINNIIVSLKNGSLFAKMGNCSFINLVVTFNFITLFGTICLTVAHMYGPATDLDHPEHKFYFIFGRYLDGFIPLIFILGVFYIVTKWKLNANTFITTIISFIGFITFLPLGYYKFPNMFGAWYIDVFNQNYNIILIYIILLITLMLLIAKQMDTSRIYNYAVYSFIFILVSYSSMSVVHQQHKISQNVSEVIKVPIWVNDYKKTNSIEKIYYDMDDFNVNQYFPLLYWSGSTEIVEFYTDSEITENTPNSQFLITSKLKDNKIIYASNGLKVYDLNESLKDSYDENISYLDIGKDDELYIYGMYHSENDSIRWTKEHSEIKLPYNNISEDHELFIRIGGARPIEDPVHGEVFINGNYIGEFKKDSEWKEVVFYVDKEYLNRNYQIIKIKTNTWKPSDYGSGDTRSLGVQLDWIEIKPTE